MRRQIPAPRPTRAGRWLIAGLLGGLVLLAAWNLPASWLAPPGVPARLANSRGLVTDLAGKDISCLALTESILFAGGADGLFGVDRDRHTSRTIGTFRYVNALLAGPDGLWVGSDDGLVCLDWASLAAAGQAGADRAVASPAVAVTFTTASGLPDNRVRALARDRDGRLWIGTWGGAVCWDGRQLQVLTAGNGLADTMVNAILADSRGDLWFGSAVAPRGGLSIRRPDGTWQVFTVSDGLTHSNVNAILPRPDGSVLVGGGLYTRGGVTRLNWQSGGWQITGTLGLADGLAGAKVRSLYGDPQGRLWAGSEYDGLAVFSAAGQQICTLTEMDGLANNEVKVILADDRQGTWIGTLSGLTYLPPGGLDDDRT